MGNSFFNNMRLKWAMLTKGPGYSLGLTERLYEIYLNHHRIIHFRDGCPVYSLSSPALFSKPMEHLLSRVFYGTLQNRRFPNMMSFAVTDECDLKCRHCSFFDGMVSGTDGTVLSTAECRQLVKDAQKLGVSVISFTGGEPLLRNDLSEIIKAVNKELSTALMFTNGSRLAEQAGELKRSGLDSVYVSIDSADRDEHDTIRGVPGSFEQALAGIEAALKQGFSVGISTCVFPDGVSDGSLEKIIELGRECGVHEVLVFCAAPSGRLKERAELIGDCPWIEEVIAYAGKFRDDRKYPGVFVYNYNAGYQSVGCSGGSRWFYVSPYGDICPCDFNHCVFGNVKDEPLYKIWERLSGSEPFSCSTWGGCKLRQDDFRTGKYREFIKP